MLNRMILVACVLLLILSGCESGQMLEIRTQDIYEGNWLGEANNIDDPEDSKRMRLDLTFIGHDGLGNEIIAFCWYSDDIYMLSGEFIGQESGLLNINYCDLDCSFLVSGKVENIYLSGNYTFDSCAGCVSRSFTLLRECIKARLPVYRDRRYIKGL